MYIYKRSCQDFVIVTQVMSSQNKKGEVGTESTVPIRSAVNVERLDCPNPHPMVQPQTAVTSQNRTTGMVGRHTPSLTCLQLPGRRSVVLYRPPRLSFVVCTTYRPRSRETWPVVLIGRGHHYKNDEDISLFQMITRCHCECTPRTRYRHDHYWCRR